MHHEMYTSHTYTIILTFIFGSVLRDGAADGCWDGAVGVGRFYILNLVGCFFGGEWN